MEIITIDADDLSEARERVCDLLGAWMGDGYEPSTLLVAFVEILDDIEDQAKTSVQ